MEYDPRFPGQFDILREYRIPGDLLRALYHYEYIALVSDTYCYGAYVRCFNRVSLQCMFHTGSYNLVDTSTNYLIGYLHMAQGMFTYWNVMTPQEYINSFSLM